MRSPRTLCWATARGPCRPAATIATRSRVPARSVARFTTLASPLITLLIAATLQAGCDIVIALAAALAMSREPTREGSVAEVGRAGEALPPPVTVAAPGRLARSPVRSPC